MQSYHSLAEICQLGQAVPGRVNSAIASLGIQPSMVLDNVRYYAESDVQRVLDVLQTPDQKPNLNLMKT